MAEVPQEQIRFAVVLNGGVSLAVWMGGVVLELDRLTRADPEAGGPYGHLLRMVGGVARADVITGTSAGGINGAALALSQVNRNAQLDLLRDLWAEQGRMEQLLRTPFQGSPVSLLRGDEFFLPRLREALERLTTDFKPYPAHDRPVDLRITTTLLSGVPSVTHDDLGQELVQSTHQGSFSFRRDPYSWARPAGESVDETTRDDFTLDQLDELIPRMALAARSSASFPFAFEPSFVPVNRGADGRPDMAPVASWTDGEDDLSRFAVDGGVLVNTPTREALEAIDRMPADGPVRRVMLLVFPHAPQAGPGTRVDGELPTTLSTGGKLLGALTSQSSRTYVERIEEHNRNAASRRGGRSALLTRLADEGETLTGSLYALTRALRGHYQDVRIRQAARDVTTRELDAPRANPAGWTFERVRAAAELAQRSWLKNHDGLPYVPPGHLPAASPVPGWPWGISMADRLASATLDLVKRLVWVVPTAADGPEAQRTCERIAEARTTLHEVRATLRRLREELDSPRARALVEQQVRRELGMDEDEPVELSQLYWRVRLQHYTARMLAADPDSIGERVRAQVDVIAGLLGEAHRIVVELSPERRRLGGLGPWYRLLTEAATEQEEAAGLAGERLLLCRVLALEVATTCLADDTRGGLDQAVELVQISLQTRNPFARHSMTADDKAGGASLGRFSGFLKRSWRVNDWIWGRLDGATMLCRVLFDPLRLRRMDRFHTAGATSARRAADVVAAMVAELFGEQLPARLADLRDEAVAQLTAVYDSGDEDVPPPCTALAELAAWGLHVRIICEELPALRQAILADHHDGADRRSRGALFLDEHDRLLVELSTPPATTADTVRLGMEALDAFDRAGIGREPVVQEAGSDQVIRTAATAAAVAVTVADSENSGFGPAKPLTRALRGAALLPYWMVTGLTRGGRAARFLGLLGLALGGALLVLALFNLLPAWAVGPAAALGSGTVLAAFGYAALRSGTLLHGLVLLSPVVPLVALAVDRARPALASGRGDDQAVTGMVTLGGVALIVAALLVLGSLPAPVGTPLAALRKVRPTWSAVVKALVAAALAAAVWAVLRYRPHELPWQVVVPTAVAAVVFGAVVSFWLGRSLQRWRRGRLGDGTTGWTTGHADVPAAVTAGWAVVYGACYLAVAVVVQVQRLRFPGWPAVLGTAWGIGLVLLLVTSWWVPWRGRRAVVRSLEEQAGVLRAADDVPAALLERLEGHGMLFRFLVKVVGDELVLTAAGKRLAQRIAKPPAPHRDQAASAGRATSGRPAARA